MPPLPNLKSSDEPFNRITRVAAAARDALLKHPEYKEGDKVIVTIDNENDHIAGFFSSGYDGIKGTAELIVGLLEHAKAIIETTGAGNLEFEPGSNEMVIRIKFADDEKGSLVQEAAVLVFVDPDQSPN